MGSRQRVESSEESEVDSDEDYRPSQGHSKVRRVAVHSQVAAPSQPSQDMTDEDDVTRCAGLVANYLLAAECKKFPVKKADLAKVVGKQHAKKVQTIIDEASKMLQKIYGYEVVELTRRKNCYLLSNLLAPPINSAKREQFQGGATTSEEDTSEDEQRSENMLKMEFGDEKQGLLFLVLTVVFMMSDLVEEVTLHSLLKCVGVYVESADSHEVFGNCKKMLDEMVKQCYLELIVDKNMEPPTRRYSWGERAHLQVCKRSILETVCRVYGGGLRPENWVDQWGAITGGTNSASSSTSMGSSVEELL